MPAISQRLLMQYARIMPDKTVPPETNPPKDETTTAVSVRRRDDFKPTVKIQLARRVGYLCSNPQCQRLTVGPRRGEDSANSIGVAGSDQRVATRRRLRSASAVDGMSMRNGRTSAAKDIGVGDDWAAVVPGRSGARAVPTPAVLRRRALRDSEIESLRSCVGRNPFSLLG